jgi:hypothetical protein
VYTVTARRVFNSVEVTDDRSGHFRGRVVGVCINVLGVYVLDEKCMCASIRGVRTPRPVQPP